MKGLVVAIAFVAAVGTAAETPISTRVPGPASAGVNMVAVAPLGDGFVALWTAGSYYCANLELRAMRVDAQMRLRDASSFLVATTPPASTIIGTAADGDGALVAWRDAHLHLARIGAYATVTTLSDDVPVGGTPVSMLTSHGYIVFLGSDPSHKGALSVTLLDRGGTVVQSGVPVVDPSARISSPQIVAAGAALLIAWIGDDGRVHTAGVLLADIVANRVPLTPVQSGTQGHAYLLRLASNGTHTMAFWYEGGGVQEIRARPLSANATPLSLSDVSIGAFGPADLPAALALDVGYQILLIENIPGSKYQIVSLRLGNDGVVQATRRSAPIAGRLTWDAAQNGDRVAAVWVEERSAAADYEARLQVVAAPIAADATVGPSTLLSLDLPVQHVRKLVPFAGGTAVLWSEAAPNQRLVVGRLSASGTPLDGAGLQLHDSPYDQANGGIATDGKQLVVVWTEGEMSMPVSKPRALYEAIITPGESLAASVRQLAGDAYGDTSDVGISWNGQSYTITYRRPADFAALRTDGYGNVIDPAPVPLMQAQSTDISPRLVSNGKTDLLLWQRWYDPFVYLPETPPCETPQPLPNELYAQRFSTLAAAGGITPVATTWDYGDYHLDAQGADLAAAGNFWLASWVDRSSCAIFYSRFGPSGNRLDPMNGGKPLMWSCSVPFLAAGPGRWFIAVGTLKGILLASVAPDGSSTDSEYIPVAGLSSLDAFALTPLATIGYKVDSSTAAYVDIVPRHRRAVTP